MDLAEIALVHSDLSPLAHLGWREGAAAFLAELQEKFGPNATLLAPTFTYSFCRGTPYDPKRTPGEVGLFGNYLLTLPGCHRTTHPIFSCAAIGPRAEELSSVSASAFGVGSIFHKLIERSGQILFFNTPFQACTAVHYTEQRIGVDYRYSKRFTGLAFGGESEWEFYVRDLDRDIVTDLSHLEELLIKEGALAAGSLLGHPTLSLSAARLDRTVERALKADPYFLLRKKCSPQPC